MDINQYWQNTNTPDTGSVALSNILLKNFSGPSICPSFSIMCAGATRKGLISSFLGSVANGVQRPPLYLVANDLTFATNVTVEEFTIWTEANDYVVNKIQNVFGTGDDSYGDNDGIATLVAGETPTPYTSTYTVTASPTNWVEPASPTWAAPSTGYGSE
jgi:rhamnogalacturonan hydrolase